MKYVHYLGKDGSLKAKVKRNCDRVCNIQDARGKFTAETGDTHARGFWRELAEWLMAESED